MARIAARYTRPGGTFYIAEFHPTGFLFDNEDDSLTSWRVKWPYFNVGPIVDDSNADYADREARVTHTTTYGRSHPLGEIVTALIDAGLVIEHLHEFPFTAYKQFPFAERRDDEFWQVPESMIQMPLPFSIKASRPA